MLTILHIEDDENDRFMVTTALNKSHPLSVVHSVRNGLQAKAYLSGYGEYADRSQCPLPEVILLDLKLPVLSAAEFMKWKNGSEFKTLPVVVLTGCIDERDLEEAETVGAAKVLQKPLGLEALRTVLEEIYNLGLKPNSSQA